MCMTSTKNDCLVHQHLAHHLLSLSHDKYACEMQCKFITFIEMEDHLKLIVTYLIRIDR